METLFDKLEKEPQIRAIRFTGRRIKITKHGKDVYSVYDELTKEPIWLGVSYQGVLNTIHHKN